MLHLNLFEFFPMQLLAACSGPRDESLSRLQTFFDNPDSSSSGYSTRRHHLSSNFSEFSGDANVEIAADTASPSSASNAVPISTTPTSSTSVPFETLAQRLYLFTEENLAHLQRAANLTSGHLAQLEQASIAGYGDLKAKVEQAPNHLTTVQHNAIELGKKTQAQLSEVRESMSQIMESMKQIQQPQATNYPQPSKQNGKKRAQPARHATAMDAGQPSVSVKFRKKIDDAMHRLQTLSNAQMTNLKAAITAIQTNGGAQRVPLSRGSTQSSAKVIHKVSSARYVTQDSSINAVTRSSPIAALQNLSAEGLVNLRAAVQHVQSALKTMPEKASSSRAVGGPAGSIPSHGVITHPQHYYNQGFARNNFEVAAFLTAGALLLLVGLRRIRVRGWMGNRHTPTQYIQCLFL